MKAQFQTNKENWYVECSTLCNVGTHDKGVKTGYDPGDIKSLDPLM